MGDKADFVIVAVKYDDNNELTIMNTLLMLDVINAKVNYWSI